MTALLDLSEEDVVSDIDSMDSDQDGVAAADYLNEQMPANAQVQADSAQVAVVSETMDEASAEQVAEDTDVQNGEVPGEAVFTSSTGVTSLAGAKLQKEQTRAKNKETLLDIINNANISEEQKQDAINGMIALTDMAEKETAAEILLEAKGFNDVVVSISGSGVDVVVNAPSLTDAQRAQIEDIVTRKTGISPENIIISPITGN
ncbi:MAG: SpoIIIAH-like family protein [Eisenbergiella sp.]